MNDIRLIHGDCLEVMQDIPDGSIDAVITDPPYGTTACKWDTVIPFEPMWEQLERVTKPRAAIVLFGSQPFTSALITSNADKFKYCWYWKKSKPNGWQHAKNKPMATVEECCVFSKAPMGHLSLLGNDRMTYNPQGIMPIGKKTISAVKHGRTMGARPNQVGKDYEAFTGFPSNVLEYPNIVGSSAIHPTQKPVALLEYLIRTYTDEGDVVLDFAMGSGTTLVACHKTGRRGIGIEIDETYHDIAVKRVAEAQMQPRLM